MNISQWFQQLHQRAFPSPELQQAALLIVHNNLDEQVTRSGLVRMVQQLLQFSLYLVSGMVFARLLSPRDFGIFAMLNSLIAFVNTFRDFGLPLAALHSDKLDHPHLNALFWLNLRLSRWLFLIMIVVAPLLAWFYSEPILVWMVMVMAVGVFILGLSSQHESLISRQMRFGTLAFIDVSSVMLGFVVGVVVAVLGPDVWALVMVLLTTMVSRSMGMWLGCRWRPSREQQDMPVSSFTRYGKNATFSKTLAHLGRNMDRIVVGYFVGATALGLYRNAYKWSTIASRQLYSPLVNVAVASLSRVNASGADFQRIARALMLPIFAISTPILTFLVVDAHAALVFLFGNQWVDAVPMFRVFCVAALISTPDLVTDWLYPAYGYTQRQLRWTLFYTPIISAAIFFGAGEGAYGVAVAYSAITIMMTPISMVVCLRVVPLRWIDYVQTLWRPCVASSVALLLWVVLYGVFDHSIVFRGMTYFVGYTATFLLLPNSIQLLKESYGWLATPTAKTR